MTLALKNKINIAFNAQAQIITDDIIQSFFTFFVLLRLMILTISVSGDKVKWAKSKTGITIEASVGFNSFSKEYEMTRIQNNINSEIAPILPIHLKVFLIIVKIKACSDAGQ